MTIDEAARLHLYEQARDVLDGAAADTLMNALPRDPDRFATSDDIARLDAKIAEPHGGGQPPRRDQIGQQ